MGSCVSCCETKTSQSSNETRSSQDQEQLFEPEHEAVEVKISFLDRAQSELTPIIYCPGTVRSECSYCKNPQGEIYDYFLAKSSIPLELFEEFFECGWWRTGELIFRPRFDIKCCPGYSLRLPVDQYKLTKKHRRVIRKWSNFLRLGEPQWEQRNITDYPIVTEKEVDSQEPKQSITPGFGLGSKTPSTACKKLNPNTKQESNTPGAGGSVSHNLTDFIAQEIPMDYSGLKHSFDIRLVPSNSLDAEALAAAYNLYDKLHKTIHVGTNRFGSCYEFHNGFCQSCLPCDPCPEAPQGSFHLQYYLDDELVMYSIVDITPQYFISVYFVYNIQLRFLSPGIFTCLWEIATVQRLKRTMPHMQYYAQRAVQATTSIVQ